MNNIIKCPHCGYEYLPCEIFLPEYSLGRPKDLVKDALGKILYTDYKEGFEPNFIEHFECENCKESFIVESIINYKVKKESEELDFKNQSVSLLD